MLTYRDYLSNHDGSAYGIKQKLRRTPRLPHVLMLERFGGVPRALVPDQLRSGVSKPSWYEPGLQRARLCFEIGELTRNRLPRVVSRC